MLNALWHIKMSTGLDAILLFYILLIMYHPINTNWQLLDQGKVPVYMRDYRIIV